MADTAPADVTVEDASWGDTVPLRQLILRPGQPVQACHFPFDDDGLSCHLTALSSGQLVGIGSIMPEDQDGSRSEHTMRIRGMAVLPERRGAGIGRMILSSLLSRAQTRPELTSLWCHARVPALALYQRAGFEQIGEVFELPEIGAHVLMQISAKHLDSAHEKRN